MSATPSPVLLTGATGFVGRALYPALVEAGFAVRCGSRHPGRALRAEPARVWTRFNLEAPETFATALAGCRAAIYLVHGMAEGGDYERRERRGAERFAAAARAVGLERIVYLGGIVPQGTASKHLRSRLATGQILRAGEVPCFELQAAMIIGAGSASWQIVRDLAARLPLMVLPRWMKSRSQPVAIDDVVAAILTALRLPLGEAGADALPGPEVLSAEEILRRTAAAMALRPRLVHVPIVTPRLSSYWIDLVTSADGRLARELVEGLRTDLVVDEPGFWRHLPAYQRHSFAEAAARALAAEPKAASWRWLLLERLTRRLAAVPRRKARR